MPAGNTNLQEYHNAHKPKEDAYIDTTAQRKKKTAAQRKSFGETLLGSLFNSQSFKF